MSNVRSIDAADATAAIRDLIDRAERRVAISVPAGTVEEFHDPLAAAVERGVLALVLVHDGDSATVDDWSDVATVVRRSTNVEPVVCTADERIGVIGPPGTVVDPVESPDSNLTMVEDLRLARLMFGSFLGNYWLRATLLFVADPDPLPARYDSFFASVVRATQALQDRQPLRVEADTYPPGTIPAVTDAEPTRRTGRLINARQSLLVPATSTFPTENSLVIEDGDDRFRIGGSGAIVEEYVAEAVRLEPVET